MAGVTSAIVALAGIGVSVGTAIAASQKEKKADEAAKVAAANLRGVKEENKLSALQAPDISKLSFERQAQEQAMTLEALQGMGPEGAAQVAKLSEIQRAQALDTAEQQAKLNYQRDAAVLGTEQDIEGRRAEREANIEWGTLQGAQLAAQEAKAQKQESIVGAIDSAGDLATGIGEATSLESQAQRNARKNVNRTDEEEAAFSEWQRLSGVYGDINQKLNTF